MSANKSLAYDRTDFSYRILKANNRMRRVLDAGSDMTIHLWFKDFLFTYEEEYLICDWTCLIGEVGGNLGFFLGGSILALSDAVIRAAGDKTKKYS